MVTDLFKLTQSEARLTQLLVMGNSLETAANALGITDSSARAYLKQVFAKCDCNRQGEQVSKVLLATR